MEIADVSFRSGGVVGLTADKRLADDSVPVVRRSGASFTQAARADFADFMWDTEHAYWLGMYRFLKDDLKVRSPITGTQMGYGPTSIQAELDYIDDHAYWQHPQFPGKPWDPNNWSVRNIALVNTPGGTLAALAGRRVAGKPYTVSEYNHPAPNQYAGEGFPMIAAFGAFQAWDGIFSFAYCHGENCEPRMIESYFNIDSHTAKIAHMPACAAMFLRGDVAPAHELRAVAMPVEAERAELRRSLSPHNLQIGGFGLEPLTALEHAVALDLDKGKLPGVLSGLAAVDPQAKVFVSDTGQIRWDVSRPGKGYFLVDSRGVSSLRALSAAAALTWVRSGWPSVRPGWTGVRSAWSALMAKASNSRGGSCSPPRGWWKTRAPSSSSSRTTASRSAITGARSRCCARASRPISACRSRPSKVEFYSLDESGKRKAKIQVTAEGEKTILPLRPAAKTVWYEIVVR